MTRTWTQSFSLLAATALFSCSSGGGSSPPQEPSPGSPIVLQFAVATASVPEGDTGFQEVQIDLNLQLLEPPLAEAVSVTVVTSGGSAASGDDFLSFADQTVTFAAGAADAATSQVTLTLLGDQIVELDETIQFQLEDVTQGAVLGAVSAHEVRILDDDTPANLAITATPDTGSALTLEDGASLEFGTDDVATPGGPTFLVVLENEGDDGVTLSPVALSGDGASEFQVDVEVAPLPPPVILSLPKVGARYAPLFAADADPLGGTQLVLDAAQLHEVAGLSAFRLEGLEAPGAGELALDLERVVSSMNPRAILNLDNEVSAVSVGERLKDSTLWRGTVQGFPDSRVYLGLSPYGARGWIRLSELPGDVLHLVAETSIHESPEGATSRLVREDQVQNLGIAPLESICAGTRYLPGANTVTELHETKALTGVGTTTAAVCSVALETDFQFFQRFNDVDATVTYIDQLFGMINDQYVADVQTQMSIAYISLWTSTLDPWAAPDDPTCPNPNPCAGDLLDEFQAAWSPETGASLAPKLTYDIATFLSGASIGGGIAYVDVLCNENFNFGVAGDMNDESPINWDFLVVAHEIGHGFGALHTHDYCPPLDQCQPSAPDQECGPFDATCGPGTIMSYCHLCNGGNTSNVALVFHPQVSGIMRDSVDDSCLGVPAGASLALRMTFDPATAGEHSATVSIPHDAPNLPTPFGVGLAGEGTN